MCFDSHDFLQQLPPSSTTISEAAAAGAELCHGPLPQGELRNKDSISYWHPLHRPDFDWQAWKPWFCPIYLTLRSQWSMSKFKLQNQHGDRVNGWEWGAMLWVNKADVPWLQHNHVFESSSQLSMPHCPDEPLLVTDSHLLAFKSFSH